MLLITLFFETKLFDSKPHMFLEAHSEISNSRSHHKRVPTLQNQWHVTRSQLQTSQQKPPFGVLEHCTLELLPDLGVIVPCYFTRMQCRMTCRRRRNQRVVTEY